MILASTEMLYYLAAPMTGKSDRKPTTRYQFHFPGSEAADNVV
jgi:hypothetical protein